MALQAVPEGSDKEDFNKMQAKTYDEAISLTGFGKFHYRILISCGLCLITFVMESLSNSYVISAAQCDFNMTSSEKGLLTSIVYIGMILSAHMWGFLADTQGRRKMLIISLFLDISCSIIASIVPSYELFVIFRFFNGIFITCASSVAFVYLGEFHSIKTRTKSMVMVCAFFSIGTTSLPALAWVVIPQKWNVELPWCSFNSWRIFILLVTAPAIVTIFLLWFLVPESPKYLLAAGQEKEALAILQKVYTLNTNNPADLYPVTSLKLESTKVHATESLSPVAILKHMWEQTKPIFMPPYLISTVLACSIQFGLYASSNGLILWVPEIFNKMSEYQQIFPNESATICTVFSTLHENQLADSFSEKNFSKFPEVHEAFLGIPPYDQSVYINGLFQTDMESLSNNTKNRSVPDAPDVCQPNLNYQAFLNSLVIGVSSGVAFIVVGYIIKYVKKKLILLTCLLGTGCCGIALYFATTTAELMALPTFFFILPAMCISVINTVVVDAFPTSLRAMALGLSLMMGRIGTICSSMLFGILLEVNCAVVIFLLSGIVIVGAILSLFIPVAKSAE